MFQPHRFWVNFYDRDKLLTLTSCLLSYSLILFDHESWVAKNPDFLRIVVKFIGYFEVLWNLNFFFQF